MNVERVIFTLTIQDMDRAIAFYRDVFGLKVKSESPFWTEMLFGDAVVALHGGGTGEFTKTGLSFQVSDAEAACKAVEEGGGRVLSGPSDRPGEPIMLAQLADTEGNGFSLSQIIG